MQDELNPNHPVTSAMREQWYKLCALLVFKSGATQARITAADIEGFMASGRANVAVRSDNDVITLSLVTDAEAKRLARHEGGLAN